MNVKPASRMDLVQEYYFSTKLKQIAEMRASGIDVLNLGIGSPDLPPSAETISALATAAQNPKNHAYQSYVGIPALREGFATFYQNAYGVNVNPVNEVLPLIGSKEGVMHISMAYLEAGDEVLVPNPGYPTYRAASLLTGATVVAYDLSEENGWLPDLKKLAEQDLSKVKLMWVNYPHMPTGAKANNAFFEELRDFALANNILIINDNPYSFILNDDPQSMLAVEGMKEVALELNSLSKSHNMAGWRLGVLVGKAEFINPVLRFKSNMDSGMFLPLQMAAVKALENPPAWFEELNAVYKERQKKVFELMDLLNCEYDHNQAGMFVWAKIPANYQTGYELSDEILAKTGVFITPGGIFGSAGDGYIRTSLCAEVSVFEEAISKIKDYKTSGL
ncbi:MULTISPECIES: aminotransferase class I/II-fold pyridoxal phosphate-dependent enzyme [unclassified Arcicella]|uniref:pyridoxal phosphate-dependent aminotransferase n=1 Tax=unclassified Arcicella TaxID=2644986 RepID=UPI00285D1533|nr:MULTISPECIES: aminotransferase class I/II-fold pyridoxal phosphate-dependent enzyme [unclassified Arcicella]MDR6560816.1 aspartate/methionine/tyrosine aminotransferase [Arcicella sp. BE51]MDR6810700.1 aspartate/methionine/tyrosine aminotransferase [Arcicella sp. BE140]MDR6822050.1 aspartate/methionine/tyrosine aminotransferase [Arcicella sp. BE139]